MKHILFFFLLLIAPGAFASAPFQQLLELTAGRVWSKNDSFFEMGIDWEYFPTITHQQLSLGLATEIEFEKQKEFYAGPLFNIYYSHIKYFLTSGLQGRDSFWRLKTRIGIGVENHMKKNLLLIPALTADFIDDEIHPGLNVGIALTF